MTVQSSITDFWNTVAPHYETHSGNTVPADSADYKGWIDLFRNALPDPPTDVLDVCSGTGFVALICASLGHRAVGIDLSKPMLDVARQMAAQRQIQVEFIQGDAVAPPFGPGKFDVITCRHTLWTLREAEKALRNWNALLRPDGRVIAMDSFHAWQPPDPNSSQDRFFRSHYNDEVQAAIPFMHIREEKPLVDALAQAGFRRTSVDMLPKAFGDNESDRPYLLVAYR